MGANSQDAKPYQAMAQVYDALIEDVNYQAWFKQWLDIYRSFQEDPSYRMASLNRGIEILEIGAGTGNMTTQLVEAGYLVTAVEPSEAMLAILQEKLFYHMRQFKAFNGTLEQFVTKQTYQLCLGFLDVLNYIAEEDLAGFFFHLYTLLKPGGVAVFDLSTPYKLEHVLGNHTFAENHEDFAYIWENHYQASLSRLDFEFSLFVEVDEDLFERHTECHTQHAHRDTIICEKALAAGLKLMGIFGEDYTEPKANDKRRHYWFYKE